MGLRDRFQKLLLRVPQIRLSADEKGKIRTSLKLMYKNMNRYGRKQVT